MNRLQFLSNPALISKIGWGLGVGVLLGGAIAGCAPPPEPQANPPASSTPDIPAASRSIDESGWTILLVGDRTADLLFTANGALVLQDKTLLSEIPVSHSSDGTTTYAKRLLVSPPSPSGNYTIIKACEGVEDGLCWSVYEVDRTVGSATPVTVGKYGGQNWVQWSSDERHAVFVEQMEGTAWFLGLNLQNHVANISEQLPAQPQLDQFSWKDNTRFEIPLSNGTIFDGKMENWAILP